VLVMVVTMVTVIIVMVVVVVMAMVTVAVILKVKLNGVHHVLSLSSIPVFHSFFAEFQELQEHTKPHSRNPT
jgi:hypothetical protein